MLNEDFNERRAHPRYNAHDLIVHVRKVGRWVSLEGISVDFNRHGLALLIDQPLAQNTRVFVSLARGSLVIRDIVGIVHNCMGHAGGFRCGIRFRTDSNRQFDAETVNQRLTNLELCLKSAADGRIRRQTRERR